MNENRKTVLGESAKCDMPHATCDDLWFRSASSPGLDPVVPAIPCFVRRPTPSSRHESLTYSCPVVDMT